MVIMHLIKHKKKMVALWCAVLIFISSGCSVHKSRRIEIGDTNLKNDINCSITGLYPDKFKAIHRVILTLAERSYVLNGYLSVDRLNREIKLIAQNELGGIVFDVDLIENGEKKIHTNINAIKKQWLEKSVLRDLETLYLAKPFFSPALFSDQHENFILSQKEGRITREYWYKQFQISEQYQLNEIRHLKNGHSIYTVKFKYAADNDMGYPEIIIIKDITMRYNLQINVQYLM